MKETIECQRHGTVILCPLFGKLLSCGRCMLCENTDNWVDPYYFEESDDDYYESCR